MEILRISDLHALDLPELNRRQLYSTALDVELHQVVGAVFLPDSSLAVANRESSQIILPDRWGGVRQCVGREGEGPGEVRRHRADRGRYGSVDLGVRAASATFHIPGPAGNG